MLSNHGEIKEQGLTLAETRWPQLPGRTAAAFSCSGLSARTDSPPPPPPPPPTDLLLRPLQVQGQAAS